MNSNHKIIQWNCRGLKSNYNEILLLLSLLSPSVFCLQETFLKTDDQLNIRDFITYNYIYSEGQRPSGGSSILVHSSCSQREIKIVTNLQAVAVSVTLDKEITICSVYIPPNFQLETEHLDTLLKQLPSPYILVGDFNGHNILWGCKDNNPKGNIIEDFITKNDLCLMNDPRVLDFLPCRGPGGSISTGNIGVIQSLSPLGRAKGSTTCLPWVASRKPEEGVLEVEGYLEYVHSDAQHASLAWISV